MSDRKDPIAARYAARWMPTAEHYRALANLPPIDAVFLRYAEEAVVRENRRLETQRRTAEYRLAKRQAATTAP